MITLNQQKVVATEQNYKVSTCEIDFLKKVIKVQFLVLNEDGKCIEKISKEYAGAEADAYWSDFVSKQFMYEKLVEEENLPIVVANIPDTLSE